MSERSLAVGADWRPGGVFALLMSAFTLFGMTVSVPGVMWEEIISSLGLSMGMFGTIQLISPLIAIALLLFGGQLAARAGKKRLGVASLSLLTLSMIALALMTSPWGLAGALAINGLAIGFYDTAVNGGTIDWEMATGRKALNLMHAAFGGGLVVGAVLTGFLRHHGWTPSAILLLVSLVGGGTVTALLPFRFPPAINHEADLGDVAGTIRLMFGRRDMLILTMIAMLASFGEQVALIWSVIYLKQREADLTIGSGTFALVGGAIMIGRLANAALVRWLGLVASLLISGTMLLLAGTLLVVPASTPAAVIGFGFLGLGVAGVIPTALAIAARLAPGRSGAVAGGMLAALYFSFMISPPLIGWLAEVITLRRSLATVALCGLGIIVLARKVPRG